MCLKVKSKKNKLVQKVYKYCILSDHLKNYVTPYRYVNIPKDGLLISNKPTVLESEEIKKGTFIYGGYIHSYINKCKAYWYKNSFFTAYALFVKATGTENDLISIALYIPALDKTKKKNDNRKVAALNKARSRKDILKIFPELKDRLLEV